MPGRHALSLRRVLRRRVRHRTKIHIHVVNDLGKPIGNAEVIVKFIQGRNLVRVKKKESWELRTTQEGTVSLPGIPQGKVLIQINAKNYQTFGQSYEIYDLTVKIEQTSILNGPVEISQAEAATVKAQRQPQYL